MALAFGACRDATGPLSQVGPVAFSKAPQISAAWSSVAPLATPRYAFGAAAGGGRIYVIGGVGAGNIALASVEVYDPRSNQWTAGPPLPVARARLAAVTGADGRIYVVGGRSPPYGGLNATVLRLDPASGVWTPVAQLPTPRADLALALGSDGRIYAIGGDGGTLSAAVEAYDPATDTWTAVRGLASPRTTLAAVTAADGRIYAIGGSDGSRLLQQVDAYTPGSDVWNAAAPIAIGRDELGAAALAGRVFIAGGENGGPSSGTLADEYSAATNAWTDLASLTVSRRLSATVAGPDGRIYAIGGLGAGGILLASVEAFRPTVPMSARIEIQPGDPTHRVDLSATNGYVRVALLSGGTVDIQHAEGCTLRFAGAAPLQLRGGAHPGERVCDEHVLKKRNRDLNGDKKAERIFRFPISALTLGVGATRACLAGLVDEGNDRGEFEGCGAVSTAGTPRAWSPIASMIASRFAFPMVVDAAGRAYAIGGWNDVQYQVATVERYDPALDQWTSVAPLAGPRSGASAAFGADGRIYEAGGYDGANAVASGQAYDPGANAWTALPPMPHPHDEAVGAFANGKFYVFGGAGAGDTLTTATVDAYDIVAGTWSAGLPLPAPRQDAAVVLAASGEIYVMGGWGSQLDAVPATTVWAFNPVSGTWRTLASLPAPRASAAAARDANGIIYLIGGDDGTATQNTVFAYDPATNTWRQVAGMASPREGEGVGLVADGRIIAAGGYDGAFFVRTAEAYAKP